MIEQTFELLTAGLADGVVLRFDAGQAGRLGVGTGREEGGPATAAVARVRRGLGRTVEEGQKTLSTHSSHPGRRAMPTRGPCRIRRNDKPGHSSGGAIRKNWYS